MSKHVEESDKKEPESSAVNINQNTYLIIKSQAEEKRYSIRQYVNELLESHVKKCEFAEKAWPGLVVDGLDPNNPNHIILRDTKTRQFYDVRLVKDELKCEQDDPKCCRHTRFVWLMPEFSKLGIKEPK
jgi:hypothetical protein